jgi:Zn-dependent peptidase ImmA (M78 family)
MALTLGFPVGFFTTAANKCGDDVGSTDAFFRSLRSTPLSERQRAVANARLFYRLSCALERHVDFPPVNIPTVPHCDLEADREQIEFAASNVRAAWNVPDGPVGNMVRLLEAHGVLVTRSEFESARVDAFSKRFPGRPVVVLGNDKGDAARSRFDAAHELGHLVLHADEDPGNARLERQANQFASSFLMPAKNIASQLPERVEWNTYVQLKRSWGVSIAALLYRSRELGIISPPIYQRAVTKMSSLGWRTSEPAPLFESESPVLLAKAMAVLEPLGFSVTSLEHESWMPKPVVEAALRTSSRASVRV